MTYHDEIITVRGRHTRLLRGGQGQPLLYLHDAWCDTWQPIHDRLAERYDVVFPLHPGFAGSAGFEEMDGMEDLVFHYLDLLEVLHIEYPILLGASFGGWLAAEVAIRFAAMLRSLILVDALGLRVPGATATDLFQLDAAQTRAALFADASSALAQQVVPETPPPAAIAPVLKARQTLARFAWQYPDDPKLARYLYRVTCPTLIVWGERDGVVPVNHGQAYQAAIATAKLAVLPSCGHLPHVECTQALAAVVLNFLESVDAGASALHR